MALEEMSGHLNGMTNSGNGFEGDQGKFYAAEGAQLVIEPTNARETKRRIHIAMFATHG